MITKDSLCRRGFVKAMVQLGAAGSIMASPQIAAAAQQRNPAPDALPERGEFIIRGAYILTMDPSLGDIPNGEIHVRNGEIAGVGKNLSAPGAETIDGRRALVLPGLVDTHWHMWTTYLRCFAGDTPERGYFPVTTACGQVMTPEDMYHGTRLAAAEAIYSGITTVSDHCHNVRSHDHAVADIHALQEVGLRAVWYYGPFRGMPASQGIDMDDVAALHRDWKNYSNDGLIRLGLAWGGVGSTRSPKPKEELDRARKEFEAARSLGIPIAVHLSARENAGPGEVEAHAKGKFLGKDVILVHVLSASSDEIKMVADGGSPISVSPGSELRIGYGLTKACDFVDAGILVCVSVDSVPLTGGASLFGIAKLLRNAENAKAYSEFKLSARRTLQMVTIDGARALGIDHLVGSLKPGKRADVIMVSTNSITMGVFTDPTHMLVEAAEPANVDTVVVDGRILKRGGKFIALSADEVIAGASASLEAIRKRANWS
jgi:5-methylthioadenosine/S-adenosylhomocysteine deaminase